MWVAAGTHKRPRPRGVFYSPGRVRRASARESPCLTPAAGRHRVTDVSGVTLSLREGCHPREATRGGRRRDLTESLVAKTQRRTHGTTRERTEGHPRGFEVLHVSQRSTTHTSTATTSVCVRSHRGFAAPPLPRPANPRCHCVGQVPPARGNARRKTARPHSFHCHKNQRQPHRTTSERAGVTDVQHDRRHTGFAHTSVAARHTHMDSLTHPTTT